MATIKKVFLFVCRMAMVSIAMSVAYILSTLVMSQTEMTMTPEEAQWAGMALLLVSTINALVLTYPIFRSRWYGLKLTGMVFLVQFGVETFITQIETLYFNHAIQMDAAEMVDLVAAGALRALIFAPLAVIILGKMRKPEKMEAQVLIAAPSRWGLRLAALALFYVFVYFLFGYFVAWQWEATRQFYTGSTAIQPFFTHFSSLFHSDSLIIPFQLLRGALWTALALLIVRMMKAIRWEASLAVSLIFAGLLSSGIGLFPNPYMPPLVRQSHFYEILFSMLLFGAVAGWFLYNPVQPEHDTGLTYVVPDPNHGVTSFSTLSPKKEHSNAN